MKSPQVMEQIERWRPLHAGIGLYLKQHVRVLPASPPVTSRESPKIGCGVAVTGDNQGLPGGHSPGATPWRGQ